MDDVGIYPLFLKLIKTFSKKLKSSPFDDTTSIEKRLKRTLFEKLFNVSALIYEDDCSLDLVSDCSFWLAKRNEFAVRDFLDLVSDLEKYECFQSAISFIALLRGCSTEKKVDHELSLINSSHVDSFSTTSDGSTFKGYQMFPDSLFEDVSSLDAFNDETLNVSKLRPSLLGSLSHGQSASHPNSRLILPQISMTNSRDIFNPTSSNRRRFSIDEGFCGEETVDTLSETEWDADFWLRCQNYRPNPHKTWDAFPREPLKEPPYLSELSSKEFGEVWKAVAGMPLTSMSHVKVSEQSILLDCFNVMVGIPSKTFSISVNDGNFSIRRYIYTDTISQNTLANILSDFAVVGNAFHAITTSLSQITSSTVAEAFTNCVKQWILVYKAFLQYLQPLCKSLLQLIASIAEFTHQLALIKYLLGYTVSPNTSQLFTVIYYMSFTAVSPPLYSLLLTFIRACSQPYLRHIEQWIFNGHCWDPYLEFPITQNQEFDLSSQKTGFWKHAFSLVEKEKSVPLFLRSIINEIFTCGKSVFVLKSCCAQHPLFAPEVYRFHLSISFSSVKFSSLCYEANRYHDRVIAFMKEDSDRRKSLKLNKENARRNRLIKARQLARKNYQLLREQNMDIEKIEQLKKDKLLRELQEQREDYIRRRKMREQAEREEDERYLQRDLDYFQRTRQIEESLREELLAYYAKLNDAALLREQRALWRMNRLNLNDKRKEFLRNENVELQKLLAEPAVQSSIIAEIPHSLIMNTNAKDTAGFEESFSSPKASLTPQLSSSNQGMQAIETSGEKAITPQDSFVIENEAPSVKEESSHSESESSDSSTLSPWSSDESLTNEESKEKPSNLAKIHKFNHENPSESTVLPHVSQETNELPYKPRLKVSYKHKDTSRLLHIQQPDEDTIIEKAEWTEWMHELPFKEFNFSYKVDLSQCEAQPMKQIFNESVAPALYAEQETNDLLDKTPLPVLLCNIIVKPIMTQVNLVNKAVMEYFFEMTDIITEFDCLTHFLLLRDGEFSEAFGGGLFPLIGPRPGTAFSTIAITKCLNGAKLRSSFASLHESFVKRLYFHISPLASFEDITSFTYFHFLRLNVKVDWPLNIIVTDGCISKYNEIFHFLLTLRRCDWVLRNSLRHLKQIGFNFPNHLLSSLEYKQCQVFRHEMQQLTTALHEYVCNQIFNISYADFMNSLKSVNDLEALRHAHSNYLKTILARILLSRHSRGMMNIIEIIITQVLLFERHLVSNDWYLDEGMILRHTSFPAIQQCHLKFRTNRTLLCRFISQRISRSYQPHLEAILLRMNFNSFFTR